MFRYMLFQIPEILIFILILLIADHWIHFSMILFWGLILLWILKELALYPLVWKAYVPERKKALSPLIGKKGLVVKPLNPQGYIKVDSVFWKARSAGVDPVERGGEVVVTDIDGLLLTVAACRQSDEKN